MPVVTEWRLRDRASEQWRRGLDKMQKGYRKVEGVSKKATDQMAEGQKKAREEVDRTTDGVEKQGGALKHVTQALEGVALAMAAAFSVEKIRGAIETAASFDRLAISTGASVEFLSKWVSIGKIMGIESQDITDAVRDLSEKVADAGVGTQGMIEAFTLLGVKVDTLRDKSPEEIFERTLRAMASVEDQNVRTFASMTLLGDVGPRLFPVADAMDKLSRKAEQLGLSLTADQAASAESIRQSFAELAAVGELSGMTAIVTAVDALASATERLNTALDRSESGGPSIWAQLLRDFERWRSGIRDAGFSVEELGRMRLTDEEVRWMMAGGSLGVQPALPTASFPAGPLPAPTVPPSPMRPGLGFPETPIPPSFPRAPIQLFPDQPPQIEGDPTADLDAFNAELDRMERNVILAAAPFADIVVQLGAATMGLRSMEDAISSIESIAVGVVEQLATAAILAAIVSAALPGKSFGTVFKGLLGFGRWGGTVGALPHYAAGGVVSDPDARLVVAHRGEGILTREATERAGGPAGIAAINAGGRMPSFGGGSPSVALHLHTAGGTFVGPGGERAFAARIHAPLLDLIRHRDYPELRRG